MKGLLLIDFGGAVVLSDAANEVAVPRVIPALYRLQTSGRYDLALLATKPLDAHPVYRLLRQQGIEFISVGAWDAALRERLAGYDEKQSALISGGGQLAAAVAELHLPVHEIGEDPADWQMLADRLLFPDRVATVQRRTSETDILIELNLDGSAQADIHTGLGFFDHMLEQIARHSGCDLRIAVQGDLHIDEHHTVEDTAIALGEAFLQALGDKRGIERYGFLLPMDDALARVAIDFSGRSWLVWKARFKREKIGDVPTEMFYHFFKSFSDAAKCNLNIRARGDNEHHKIEAIFKGLARAIRMAVRRDPRDSRIPSTKGVL